MTPTLVSGAELAALMQQRAALEVPRPAPLTAWLEEAEARAAADQARREQEQREEQQQQQQHEE